MTQTSFLDRPKPEELNFKPGSQNHAVYTALLHGPVTNAEIVRKLGVFNSTGRVSDIRKKLRPYMMDVQATPMGTGGLYVYNLRGF